MFTDAELMEEEPRLRRYAIKLANSGAEDLLQDTLIRALAKRHLWEPTGQLRSWLFRMMFNQHISNLRTSTREHIRMGFLVNEEIDDDPRQDAELGVRLEELRAAVRRLPVDMRRVLCLATLGHSYDDMQAALGIPHGTVRSRLSRARDRLRENLDMLPHKPRPRRNTGVRQ